MDNTLLCEQELNWHNSPRTVSWLSGLNFVQETGAVSIIEVTSTSIFQDNGNNVTDLGGFTFLSKQLIVEGSQFSHFMMRLKCLSACLRVLKPQCYLSLLPNVCFAKLCQPPTAADCLASVFRRDTWVLILLTIMHHAASDTSKSPHCHSISAVVSKSDSNILDINCDTFLFLHFHSRNWGCGHFYHQSPVVTINYMQQAWYSHMM